MSDTEKKFTLEDVKASTTEADSARYRFVGCMYKTLIEELGQDKANELMNKAYYRYGYVKHPEAEIREGDLVHFCETYRHGEHTYYPYSMDMPCKIDEEKGVAVIQWCTGGVCGGLQWFTEGGLTPEEANSLCWNAAVAGDIGYANKCGLDAHFNHTCATGKGCCEFVVEKRKP